MQFAITIDPAALLTGLSDQVSLTCVFPSPSAQRALQPCIEAAGLDAQAAAHRAHLELLAMLGNERASYLASLAKYAVAFLRCRAPR